MLLLSCTEAMFHMSTAFGSCDNAGRNTVNVVENIDFEGMEGLWYLVKRQKPFLWHSMNCPAYQIDDGLFGTRTITTVGEQWPFGNVAIYSATWYKSWLGFNFFGWAGNNYRLDHLWTLFDPQYQVINVDYSKYAVMFGCVDYLFYHQYYAEILSREKQLDNDSYQKALEVLKVFNYDGGEEFDDGLGKDCDQGIGAAPEAA
mmetsp:Transcript_7428/g.12551  ORF Transcript_7428/g.12551 Transcript_7428/m.12551 type:complete len:202 (-) Transcript_7428:38-643(-)|eukprot:CAMPEP_0168613788 /NCGR_PEP_ID=MMETSP0449_2-20121227/3634_1 /TAXON_ID=1082188 /ORGANISM="Strombidium rassoulzadegani, Strain ras09" /LENGTH=201 /DNA_ID=CAMNT_0008654437 /DNA_START=35 /DNA_END=640 /DNA_ORIENTATION=-